MDSSGYLEQAQVALGNVSTHEILKRQGVLYPEWWYHLLRLM